MGGSLLWAGGIAFSLAWPGLVALAFTRLRWSHIDTPGRFLRLAIPLSYIVILCAHGLLADVILVGVDRAVETGQVLAVWWRIVFVLGLETGLAAVALYGLERHLRRPVSPP